MDIARRDAKTLTMYTQCPRCRTTFAVTEEQMKARAGLVRCGRCHAVFQAEETLFDALPPVTKGASPRQEPSFENVAPAPAQALAPDRPAPRRSPVTWPWLAIDLVLLLALAGQWIYVNRDRLAVNPVLQPYVARACTRLPCGLNPPQKLSAIELSHVRVTAHPRFRHALQVRFTLINRAPFAQPYPDVQLSLFGPQGTVVARALFPSRDYVRGAPSLMDPNVAKREHFGVTRPGGTAVLSYELHLYPAREAQ
ncbi:MAG: DUF3426 domain-containing protein [Acidiferrobacteraceae bacterium]